MNDIPKVKFSTTQTNEWTESRIARGDLAQEITGLKRESGGDIMAHGGAVTFVQALSKLGLIDEVPAWWIRPVDAEQTGCPSFKDCHPGILRLLDATTYPDAPPSTSTNTLGVPDTIRSGYRDAGCGDIRIQDARPAHGPLHVHVPRRFHQPRPDATTTDRSGSMGAAYRTGLSQGGGQA